MKTREKEYIITCNSCDVKYVQNEYTYYGDDHFFFNIPDGWSEEFINVEDQRYYWGKLSAIYFCKKCTLVKNIIK
jgi:hypothetical protein